MFILVTVFGPVEGNLPSGYIIGAVISILLFAYLLYTLIKPEKF